MGFKIKLVNKTTKVIGLSSLAVVLPDKARSIKLSEILELKSRHKKDWRIPVEINHSPSEMSLDSCEHALKMSAIVFMFQPGPDGSPTDLIIAKGVPETTYFRRRILDQALNQWKKRPLVDIDMKNPQNGMKSRRGWLSSASPFLVALIFILIFIYGFV